MFEKRTIIQVTTEQQKYHDSLYTELYALCSDGSLWVMEALGEKWKRIKNVPQPQHDKSEDAVF